MQRYCTDALTIKEIKTTSDIKDALLNLCVIDCDFNGSNGPDYLWPDAAKTKFKTNAEYLIDYVINNITDKSEGVLSYAKSFAEEWKKRDSYYEDIDISVEKLNGQADDEDIKGVYALSIVATYFN